MEEGYDEKMSAEYNFIPSEEEMDKYISKRLDGLFGNKK